MLALVIIAGVISIFAFFYGAIKLWKKGKPLYFQIILCSIGCYALYQLFVIVMTFCDVNETYFNDGFFGLFGCNLFLFCANRGAIEKMFERPKIKHIVLVVFVGVLMLALSIVVAIFYFGEITAIFFIFILQQIPACFVVYFNVKHFFIPVDELGLIKGLRLTDIFSMAFCVISLLDIAAWINPSILSGIADLVLSLVIVALSVSAVKGAEKWSY